MGAAASTDGSDIDYRGQQRAMLGVLHPVAEPVGEDREVDFYILMCRAPRVRWLTAISPGSTDGYAR